jgi:UDP-GlcNAc:undecaprenyl-phosphate GlcNAc-1-phosphate transferase
MPTLIALALSVFLTPLLASLGRRVGLVDRPSEDGLKIHPEPKPLTGGIGIVAATLVAIVIAGESVEPFAAASILLLLGVGVVDDVVALPPTVRLAAQFVAGALLAVAGASFEPLGDVWGPAVVVLAVPAVANAVNIADGQDGLSAGLAAAAALGMSLVMAAGGVLQGLGPALGASLLGFLVWNRPPARVFLGDGGAYAVGGLLVLVATTSSSSWHGLLATTVCLGIFALELGTTLVRRAFSRTSLVSGDRAHVYDLLALRLASRDRATATMVAAGLAAAGIAWAVVELPLAAGVVIALAGAVASSVGVWALWKANGVRLRRSR